MTAVGDPTDDPPTAATAEESAGAGEAPAPATRRLERRWIGLVVLTLGVLVLLSAGWVSWRTYQAYRHLDRAAGHITELQNQVKNLDSIDLAATSATVDRLGEETRGAVGATSDPLYRLAGHLPWIGPNLRAMRTIADTANGLAGSTAPSLVAVARTAQPSSLAPRNGAIDITPIAAAATRLTAADQQVKAALSTIAGIDQRALAGPFARAVGRLQAKLGTLEVTTAKAARIGRLAPPMLGANGPRKYLVVFENLAEARATGGLFGSFAVLTVDRGKLSLAGQGSVSRNLGEFTPALPVPASLPTALYGGLPGAFAIDTNLTPDYPSAVATLAEMYRIRYGLRVDGVLALDPIALGYMLKGAQPIAVGHGLTMTSGNITSILLSKAYQLYPKPSDGPPRDQFLAQATTKAFTAVTETPGNASSVVKGLTTAANEHRVLLWSSHPAEQLDLAGTAIAELLPPAGDPTPTIGLLRNDGTGGKLGYYADGSATATPGACDTQGRRTLTVTLQMDYSAPSTGLPAYVLGYAKAGPYVLRTNVMVFSPGNSTIESVTVDGRTVPVIHATEGGRPVAMVTVDQKPAQQSQVVATLLVPASSAVAERFEPAIIVTPGIKNWPTSTAAYGACPAAR